MKYMFILQLNIEYIDSQVTSGYAKRVICNYVILQYAPPPPRYSTYIIYNTDNMWPDG